MSVLKYKYANCVNCYKCIRNCPVKAIEFSDGQARIIEDDCIYCGQCVKSCPQHAKSIRLDFDNVKKMIAEGKQVIASVAPSYVSAFDALDFQQVRYGLKKLGFFDAFETAMGANIVKSKYEEILQQDKPDILISSCCDSVNMLIQKYYPELLPLLAKVLTPMQAHGQYLKQLYPDAYVVFIGPCVAKKQQVQSDKQYIDATITFAEIKEVLELEKTNNNIEPKISRLFPLTGGVIKTMKQNDDYEYVSVDGVQEVEETLKQLVQGNIHHVFIEMNTCRGGCLNGPGMPDTIEPQLIARQKLTKVGGNDYQQDFNLSFKQVDQINFASQMPNHEMPSEAQIEAILAKIGKHSKKDELNCGGCGYNSCREKAIAVFQGKADLEMCLPFMKEKAESISRQVLEASPNAVLALDTDFKIQLINPAAYTLLNINPNEVVINETIEHWISSDFFIKVLSEGSIIDEVSYLPNCQKYVEKRVVYDDSTKMILMILKDCTSQQHRKVEMKSINDNTIEITNVIITKQMRIVQEIASLLGETTAETKVALNRLRDVIAMQNEKDES